MSRRDFRGRHVVVTGAAGGLGHALCLRLAAAGARVTALDRDVAALARLAAELAARPVEHLTATCDVSDATAVVHALDQSRHRLGPIDVLVNNAGITQRSLFARTRPEVMQRVMAVNLFGAMHCTQAALPDLLARRGSIIVVSSVAGFAPLLGRTGYAASKHALHGMFESLRTELEPADVHVMLVCPAFIDTGIERAALGGDGLPASHARAVVGRRASADEVACRILRAAERGQALLLPGAVPHLAWWLSRLAPRLYARLMARSQRSEMM